MQIWHEGNKLLAAVVSCFILPGMLALLLLAGKAYAQADRQVGFQNLLDEPANLEKSATLPEGTGVTGYPPSELHQALSRKLAASRWWHTNLPDPLPPASVFAAQNNLRQYLNGWPTPGLTVCPAEQSPPEELTDDDLM